MILFVHAVRCQTLATSLHFPPSISITPLGSCLDAHICYPLSFPTDPSQLCIQDAHILEARETVDGAVVQAHQSR